MFLVFLQCPGTVTTGNGAPIGTKTAIQTAGPRGPVLLQDVSFIDEITHFDRERIPGKIELNWLFIIYKKTHERALLVMVSWNYLTNTSQILINWWGNQERKLIMGWVALLERFFTGTFVQEFFQALKRLQSSFLEAFLLDQLPFGSFSIKLYFDIKYLSNSCQKCPWTNISWALDQNKKKTFQNVSFTPREPVPSDISK